MSSGPDASPVSTRAIRVAVTALIVEPLGLGAVGFWLWRWTDPTSSVLSVLVGVTGMILAGTGALALLWVGLKLLESGDRVSAARSLQWTQYQLRFGSVGTDAFKAVGLWLPARRIQQLLSASVPVWLLIAVTAP